MLIPGLGLAGGTNRMRVLQTFDLNDCFAAVQAQLKDVFRAAVEGGVTFFDTAEVFFIVIPAWPAQQCTKGPLISVSMPCPSDHLPAIMTGLAHMHNVHSRS